MKLIDALKIANQVTRAIAPHCERVEVAGSIRRQKGEIKDIEIVAIPKVSPMMTEGVLFETATVYVSALYRWAEGQVSIQWIKPGTSEIIPWKVKPDGKYYRGLIRRGVFGAPSDVKLDLFIARPENWGVIYTIRTGSAEFSMALVTHVRDSTIYLVRDGNLVEQVHPMDDGKVIACCEEKELFARAGIDYIIPRLRRTARDVKMRLHCGPHACGHSVAEHAAFDAGLAVGELGEPEENNPFTDERRFDWITGWSVGHSNRSYEPA